MANVKYLEGNKINSSSNFKEPEDETALVRRRKDVEGDRENLKFL
jgi:hypothetical protein